MKPAPLIAAVAVLVSVFVFAQQKEPDAGLLMLRDPILVYNNWSAYDELSDNVQQTEQLAMRELDELLRLRRAGVRFDYYVMDAFWYAKGGGYRGWRKSTWPNGPGHWLARCRENGIKPGLWFGTNLLVQLDPAPEWENSLNKKRTAMCLYRGGFLPHFMQTLQLWYYRGIRMFKFDFVDFTAAPPDVEASTPPEEIRRNNENAFRDALRSFREKNPGVILVGFNGFGGDMESTAGPFPFKSPIDLRWLTVFDSIYSGDPRPSDVPMMNFWRSQDLYSDHMVRRFEDSGVPLERIDGTSVMYGTTGTVYYRRTNAWKSGLLMMLARGGWVNTIHGNLELIDDKKAAWMAKAVSLYLRRQALGRTKTFGGIPGQVEPYGFASLDSDGALYTVVNPSEAVSTMPLPQLSEEQRDTRPVKILFRDAGFMPRLSGDSITLGPEQMAVIGKGKYAGAQFDLGIEDEVVIPQSIEPLPAAFEPNGRNAVKASLKAPPAGRLRIVMQQRTPDGYIQRTWAGGPPKGKNMADIFKIEVSQEERPVPVRINYGKVIWSGLSWAVGEVDGFTPGESLQIRCTSAEKDEVKLDVKVYRVQ
ncbi:MAG: hypothetical protein JOY62_12755 [Acidobacteriaceae bacterium]|nr:hypothetical protein [Acidobacteriaceae bacterium]MBV9780830.1 hypothetical protein [Acidobacteriaceae bacterium]